MRGEGNILKLMGWGWGRSLYIRRRVTFNEPPMGCNQSRDRWRHEHLLLIDHDLTEHGAEQARPAIGDAVRLDVDISSPDGVAALQM